MKTYFPGLNGLRFIGAFTVILGHIEFIKSLHGLPNLMDVGYYKNTNGHLGVLLFFVLSGFLITYLLLNELNEKNTIEIGKFYMRRILRIWPLYYLMIIISLFVAPLFYSSLDFHLPKYTNTEEIYYLLFLPNIAKSLGHYINGAVHLWSIGVEEQFYLIWPILILLFRKYILWLLVMLFIGITLLPFFIDYLNLHTPLFQSKKELYELVISFVSHFKINAMAFGGIVAYILYKNKNWLRFLKNDAVEVCVFFGTLLLWGFGIVLTSLSDEVYALLFACIIYTIASKEKPIISLENRFFNFLGKISYGLYVYHWLVIFFTVLLLKRYDLNVYLENILLYTISISLTILLAYLSFVFFEKPLLKLKKNFN